MLSMLKNKKGQGLSLNVIIVAAIVLIVLIVLWAIFTGRMGTFAKTLSAEEKAAQAAAQQIADEAAASGAATYTCTGDGKGCITDAACPTGTTSKVGTCAAGQICCGP